MLTIEKQFQSSPVIADGRDRDRAEIGVDGVGVSILARHC